LVNRVPVSQFEQVLGGVGTFHHHAVSNATVTPGPVVVSHFGAFHLEQPTGKRPENMEMLLEIRAETYFPRKLESLEKWRFPHLFGHRDKHSLLELG